MELASPASLWSSENVGRLKGALLHRDISLPMLSLQGS